MGGTQHGFLQLLEDSKQYVKVDETAVNFEVKISDIDINLNSLDLNAMNLLAKVS